MNGTKGVQPLNVTLNEHQHNALSHSIMEVICKCYNEQNKTGLTIKRDIE
jgi:hypothetical protein